MPQVGRKRLGFWIFPKAPLGFVLVPVCCGNHQGEQIPILAGYPGGQVSEFSQPYRQGHTHSLERGLGAPQSAHWLKDVPGLGKTWPIPREADMGRSQRPFFDTYPGSNTWVNVNT